MDIRIKHTGVDYYGIELNGDYREVSIATGKTIEALLKALRIQADNSF